MQAALPCLSILTAILLEGLYASSTAYDRPVHTAILCLLAASITLHYALRLLPNSILKEISRNPEYEAIPLEERNDHSPSDVKKPTPSDFSGGWLRKRSQVLVATAVLALRLELFRQIIEVPQCTARSYEVFIPLLLVIYDIRHQKLTSIEECPDDNVYDGLMQSMLKASWRYVPSTALCIIGCYALTGLWTAQTSTVICPISSGHAAWIPKAQQLAFVLDSLLLIVADEIGRGYDGTRTSVSSVLCSYKLILSGATVPWLIFAVAKMLVRIDAPPFLLLWDLDFPLTTFLSIGWHMLLFSSFVVATACHILVAGSFHVSFTLTAILTVIPGALYAWAIRRPFPPTSSFTVWWSFIAIFVGAWSYLRIRRSQSLPSSSRFGPWITVTMVALAVLLIPGLWKTNSTSYHPIELLMFDAKSQHNDYFTAASWSKNLSTAVEIYRQRYKSQPPPGFDVWWDFAQNRSATITDDFDQVFADLLPFRAVSPADLRRQTWELVSNPWNEISGISIRGGRAEVQENVLPTHRWMLDGVAVLINAFAEHLPDMDIAFNLNDESRVAVPYHEYNNIVKLAKSQAPLGKQSWSEDRAETWSPVATEELTTTVLENWSFRSTFSQFGSAGCPPWSLARTRHYSMPPAYTCVECAAAHSFGQFVSNWSLAADPCHQPDFAQLHGLHVSPAAYKATNKLVPVFSQSKAYGYNDILYPSAWNYIDKVQYKPTTAPTQSSSTESEDVYPDPLFSQKANTLYWRGATSEGVSPGTHTWRGMTRQRLVHMANNLTTSHHDQVTILMPDPKHPTTYRYQTLSAKELVDLDLGVDVAVVDHIDRCGGMDCTDQEREFGLVDPVNFQEHWRYRYLFDMDGAGFSGRFLPFLQSRSLPFKTAIFREWYDTRLTPWRHFVPQDLRLHGLWSTLAYFQGINGVVGGREYQWEGHVREAQIIADQGREWADAVLRKEDMEIYFFRLLLEWGRLTDDRRDELGFDLEQ